MTTIPEHTRHSLKHECAECHEVYDEIDMVHHETDRVDAWYCHACYDWQDIEDAATWWNEDLAREYLRSVF